MQNKPFVYILILNWNSYAETIECVKACQQLAYSNFRILILDNKSGDDSVKQLSMRLSEIEIIQTGKNLGYAAGNNIGIRHALGKQADYVWILNPDMLVTKDSLVTMIDVLVNNPSIGICGPRVIHGKEPSTFSFDGLSISPDSGYEWRFNLIDQQKAQPILIDVDCVSGCSMLIRKNLLCTIGLFCEDFFLYYEDVELSLRARDYGWRTVICSNISLKHDQNVQVKKYSTGFRAERSRIILAKLRNNCTIKNLVTKQSILLLMTFLRKFRLFKALKLFLGISLGILCGLVKANKSLPVVK